MGLDSAINIGRIFCRIFKKKNGVFLTARKNKYTAKNILALGTHWDLRNFALLA